MSSTNTSRLNAVRDALLACRTNDPDEAAIYIGLIEKIDELMNYQGEVKRVDQWVNEIDHFESLAREADEEAEAEARMAEAQDRHAERFNESHNDFVERVFAKIQEL